MERWIVSLASLSAAAGVVALALFLAGVFDGDDASGARDAGGGNEVAGVCAADNPDCEDTLVAPDGDDENGGDANIAPVCAPDHPDCVDTVVSDGDGPAEEPASGDGGTSISPVCAPGFPDCEDMIVVPADEEGLEDDR